MGFTGGVNLQHHRGRRIQRPLTRPFLPRRTRREEAAEELAQAVEFPLPGNTAAVPLAVVQIRGELVCRVGEEVQPQAAAPVAVVGDTPVAEAIPVKKVPSFDDGSPKFTKVEIVCKETRLESLKNAMMDLGITGMTVSHVLGCGLQKGQPEYYRGVEVEANLLPKIQVDIVVSKVPVRHVIETAKKVLYTGHIGDGKIFVYDVENVVKVRTGEEGYDALQDVE